MILNNLDKLVGKVYVKQGEHGGSFEIKSASPAADVHGIVITDSNGTGQIISFATSNKILNDTK